MKGELVIYPPTLGPVVKGAENPGEYRIWLRGSKPGKKDRVFGVVCFFASTPLIYQIELLKDNDYISCVYVKLEMEYWAKNILGYPYMAGYYYFRKSPDVKPSFRSLVEAFGLHETVNKNLMSYVIRRNMDIDTSFVFGSCRRYVNIGPISLMGTGREGDKIYDSIANEFSVDFFLSIGDQVYFDPLNEIGRRKTLGSMRDLYKKIRSYPGLKYLMSNVPTYEICDDHDAQINDCCRKTREAEPETFLNAQKAYREYQHWLGPVESINKPLWYSFKNKNCDFFVFDTRTERDEIDTMKIISDTQFEAFKTWITDPRKRSRVKFIVSSVVFCSQPVEDSWFGFPKQQKAVLDLVLGLDARGHKINHCFFLCGDVHACRYATYNVLAGTNIIGNITEIISSGLVAVRHDSGKPYDPAYPMDRTEYDIDNDFPFTVNNGYRGGYTFETVRASPTFPEIKRGKTNNLFGGSNNNVYTRVEVLSKEKILHVYFKNSKGDVLHVETVDFNRNDDAWIRSLTRLGGECPSSSSSSSSSTSSSSSSSSTSSTSSSSSSIGEVELTESEFFDKDLVEDDFSFTAKYNGNKEKLRSRPRLSKSKSDSTPFSSSSRRKMMRTKSLVEEPSDWEL